MSGDAWRPEGTGGTVRLFPLPDLVMFPHVVQALHIFEPRYIAMVEEALAADRQIAMVLLRDGWKLDTTRAPPIHATACLGRIVSHNRLENGRYNLLLAGIVRARILQECETDAPFRLADVHWQPDQYAQSGRIGCQWPALQQHAHHRAVLSHPHLHPDRTKPPLQCDVMHY